MVTEVWRGIFKLIEEAGEVQQACGKLCVYTDGVHPDGENWREKMKEELADLAAALLYVQGANFSPAEQLGMELRTQRKLDKFIEWGLRGVKT